MTQTADSVSQQQAQDYIRRGLDHLWIHTQQVDELAQPDNYLVVTSGEGIYLNDAEGNRYIDAMSGLWVVAVGHGRRELAEVARRQMESLSFANPFAYATPSAVDLASKLATLTPEGITKSYFVNSGSEAVEAAIRMAKQWHYNRGDKKRYKVISRIGSYHGTTAGAMSVNNSSYTNKVPFEPLMPGSVKIANVFCPRCPYEKAYPDCSVFCARIVEDVVKAEGPETVAAIIGEPISTANGSFVPPPEYWRILRDVCDKYGIVLIADEVINGFGRTGKWFGIQHFDVVPDLMTVAKQLSSGYAPIAAVLASDKIFDGFRGDPSDAFVGGSTWGANPVSCAVALANLEIIERERLVENSAKVGDHMAEQLRELQSRHRVISATRGVGLMHVIDMKRNVEAGEDFRAADEVGKRVSRLLREQGLLSRGGTSIQVAPPLVTNVEEADEIVDMLDRAIGNLEQELGL
jgi:adenosylmethionine-8-amino-7-oxononanoate aminotransferase